MYDTLEITKDRISAFENEAVDLELGNSKLGIGVIMTMSAFLGIWGVTCVISGLANSGSLQEIGRGLLTAISGI